MRLNGRKSFFGPRASKNYSIIKIQKLSSRLQPGGAKEPKIAKIDQKLRLPGEINDWRVEILSIFDPNVVDRFSALLKSTCKCDELSFKKKFVKIG